VLDGTLTGVFSPRSPIHPAFFQPSRICPEKFNLLQSAMASSERVFALLDEQVVVREPATPTGCIVQSAAPFDSRTCGFRYSPDGPGCCANISFTAYQGKPSRSWGTPGPGRPRS